MGETGTALSSGVQEEKFAFCKVEMDGMAAGWRGEAWDGELLGGKGDDSCRKMIGRAKIL